MQIIHVLFMHLFKPMPQSPICARMNMSIFLDNRRFSGFRIFKNLQNIPEYSSKWKTNLIPGFAKLIK